MRGVFRTLLLSLYVYVCYSGYCTQTYSCPKTCYRTTDYTTSCGFWDQWRCTRYRQRGYTCYHTGSRQICCPGYTGSYCHQPICFGGTSCPNGGVCTAPGVCSCAVGFGGLRCDDINECETETSNCANTFGSHVCSCRPGFRLLADERSCLDINECDVDNGGCPSPQVCLNEPGTFHCQCKPGYVFTPDKQSCVDEDECTSGTANCSHVCTNEVGSYRCSCKDGFVLSEDQHSCEDYDECTAKEYPCMQDCHNTIGAFVCSCLNGFELQSDGKTCVAINKCAVRNGGCDQRCKSEAGYQYCECYPGYRLNEDGFSCADIDECSEQLSGCEHGCNNSVGSFVCSCAQGFQLDSNNRTCVDEDDCLSVVCSNGGTCEDGISSYSCKCPNGYSGSNCHFDLDECQSFNGGCEEICTNLIGSYKCSCPAGRTLLPDGHTCSGDEQSDISEIEPILDEIADNIFSIVQNSTLSLDEMYNSTVYMKQTLARLNDHNIYCSEAPVFKSPLANVTIYEGGKAVFLCDVTAYPDPVVWWFKDNKVMDSAMSNRLEIVNTSLADIATYRCMAGNIVANLTSNVAYLLIVENIRNVTTCSIDNGGCAHVCHDRVGGVNCTCKNGYNIDEDDQTKCVDIDECAELGHGCEVCNNSEGSFICKCFDGNIFNEDTKSCVKGNDKCALIGLNCSNTSGCHEGEADELSCYCAEGFWMSSNKTECIDIDECEQSVCDHICTNTLGSYMCSCDVGYQLERSICVGERVLSKISKEHTPMARL